MRSLIISFVGDESGATAIEYGLIAAVVAVVALPALSIVGGSLSEALAEITKKLSPAGPEIRAQ
jgi:pilus assembly protein Flp/PilA